MNSKNRACFEWLFLVADYYDCRKKGEGIFEQGFPVICSVITALICLFFGLLPASVRHLSEILPNVLSILIGFTISVIAIITSIADDKEKKINKASVYSMNGHPINYKQWVLVNLVYYTLCEVFSLIMSLLFPLIQKLFPNIFVLLLCLFVYVYMLLRILFGLTKVLTKLYFILFKNLY